MAGKRSSLRPLRPSRNLTDRVVGRITDEIRSGRLSPGARLPTEQELMTTFGVSRTVVREAVSALRAEGLVLTRQGSGAFVASDTSRVPFRIDPDGLSSIEDVLSVMELRLAIEVEAAALAAERAGSARLHAIDRAVRDFDKAIGSDEGAIAEDFAFHRAIAHAAANGLFPQFLEFLGRHVIPRQSVRTSRVSQADQRAYLEVIQKEHLRIAEAIKARDPAEARAAMRAHLSKSLDRYRSLAERGRKRD
ncbi:MAG: FadR/GntR family transcriptional regulator [Hyphomicrobiaceae bacterium]